MQLFFEFPQNSHPPKAEDQSKTGRLNFEQFMVWYASNGQGLSGKTWDTWRVITISFSG